AVGVGPGSAVGAKAHRAVGLAAVLPLAQGLALVVGLLAARDTDLDLDPAVLEVHGQRNDGHALLAGLGPDLLDLIAVQQELALAPRLVVRPRALGVLGDVRPLEPDLAVVRDAREGS